jgi:hypothetical protein
VSVGRLRRYLTANRRRLPDYIIAGAQKAGTTSLWAYLQEHPQVVPAMAKETSFFDINFHRGLNWYRMHFPLAVGDAPGEERNTTTLTSESTAYYMFHPLAAERIARCVPRVKIILLLRNPVDRAFSHYQLKLRRRQETLSFEEAIEAEAERLDGEADKIVAQPDYYSRAHDRHSYLARGVYIDQIRRWQRYFPPSQLLILESGEFFSRTRDVYHRVLFFLGLPGSEPANFGNRFPGRYKARMSPPMRRKLLDYFAPYNEQLFAHLGTRYDWDK